MTQMNLEDILLRELGQLQKDKDRMVPLLWGISSSQIHEVE